MMNQIDLMVHMAQGMAMLTQRQCEHHVRYLQESQQEDGGFPGRQGQSDPYYTSFAVRALILLGQFNSSMANRIAHYFSKQSLDRLTTVDFISAIHSIYMLNIFAGIDVLESSGIDLCERADSYFQQLGCPDGGYLRSSQGRQSSTYITYLVISTQKMLELPVRNPIQTAKLIRSRQREHSGYAEMDMAKHGGTNPTAAATGLLSMLGVLDKPTIDAAVGFLVSMQAVDGGLRANAHIPVADLLSTFTGLAALESIDSANTIDYSAARRFVGLLERPEGGFRAGVWDADADVEYTFYGLGALALLNCNSR